MNVITLDMDITADEAIVAHDALPQTAPKQKRDAYWRRYSRIKNGITDACTYTSSDEAEQATPPASPADRVEMIRNLAEKGKSAPVRTPAPKQAPSPRPANPRTRTGRTASIPATDRSGIHARINSLAEALGYGDLGFGRNIKWGAAAQFARKAGLTSQSTYHDTVRCGRKIWPAVIEAIAENFGASRKWLLTGHGDMLEMAVESAHFNPAGKKATPPDPMLQPLIKLPEPDAANWQPLIKRPPGGVLFDPIAFNVDQTFSIVGKAAFTSRFATPNDQTTRGNAGPPAVTGSPWVRLAVTNMFYGRKGHGGGPCLKRVLNADQLTEILHTAYEAGRKANDDSAQLRATSDVPSTTGALAAAHCSGFVACEGCADEMCGQIGQCVAGINAEVQEIQDDYIKAGKCADCGACSLKEAKGKCRPQQSQSGEWHCGGDQLWEGEDE